MLNNPGKFEPLASHCAVLHEKARRDGLGRLALFVCLEKRANRENSGSVENNPEKHNALEDHSFDSLQKGPKFINSTA